jgi:23S rRNA pseudouridine1911/1915/1917 synthase
MPGSEDDEVLISRQALHAWRLRFRHPRLERWMEFEAPLPADMTRTLEALRRWRGKT